MLVLQKAVKMVWSLPEVMGVSCVFMVVMLSWLVLWSFGVAGIVALSIGDSGRWWLLVVSWQVFALDFELLQFQVILHQTTQPMLFYWICRFSV